MKTTNIALTLAVVLTTTSSMAAYVKVDAEGNRLLDSATEWSCVYDDVNELLWEVKTDDDGLHDKNNTYRWGGETAEQGAGGSYNSDWDELVDESNQNSLCGQTDWKVPSVDEMRNLVEQGSGSPAIDASYFPNTRSTRYWTSSAYSGYSTTAWVVDFDDGAESSGLRGSFLRVRLLRTGPLAVIEEPLSIFTATPATGTAPLVVTLDGTASSGNDGTSGSILTFSWDSSDGQSATGNSTSLSYNTAGNYTITLSITDQMQQSATSTQTVVVEEEVVETLSTALDYNVTARISPQVIAGGISPSMIDTEDTQFDIVGLVRPGILPIDRVTFQPTDAAFSMIMTPAGILNNGDQLFTNTFTFQRGAFGTMTMQTTWGSGEGQYNIVAYDEAQQRSHQFPDLMFGNYPEQQSSLLPEEEVTYNSTKRLAPQIILGGYSPALSDIADTTFDIIAVVREGVLPIETVSLGQNLGAFQSAMAEVGTLSNGDRVYKMSYSFAAGSFGTATLSTLWGSEPGQFNISVVDEGQQRSHSFPDILFGSYPAQ